MWELQIDFNKTETFFKQDKNISVVWWRGKILKRDFQGSKGMDNEMSKEISR